MQCWRIWSERKTLASKSVSHAGSPSCCIGSQAGLTGWCSDGNQMVAPSCSFPQKASCCTYAAMAVAEGRFVFRTEEDSTGWVSVLRLWSSGGAAAANQWTFTKGECILRTWVSVTQTSTAHCSCSSVLLAHLQHLIPLPWITALFRAAPGGQRGGEPLCFPDCRQLRMWDREKKLCFSAAWKALRLIPMGWGDKGWAVLCAPTHPLPCAGKVLVWVRVWGRCQAACIWGDAGCEGSPSLSDSRFSPLQFLRCGNHVVWGCFSCVVSDSAVLTELKSWGVHPYFSVFIYFS